MPKSLSRSPDPAGGKGKRAASSCRGFATRFLTKPMERTICFLRRLSDLQPVLKSISSTASGNLPAFAAGLWDQRGNADTVPASQGCPYPGQMPAFSRHIRKQIRDRPPLLQRLPVKQKEDRRPFREWDLLLSRYFFLDWSFSPSMIMRQYSPVSLSLMITSYPRYSTSRTI